MMLTTLMKKKAAYLKDTRLPFYTLDGVARPDGEILLC